MKPLYLLFNWGPFHPGPQIPPRDRAKEARHEKRNPQFKPRPINVLHEHPLAQLADVEEINYMNRMGYFFEGIEIKFRFGQQPGKV